MKVAELTGALLDYWTGKAEGKNVKIVGANSFEGFSTEFFQEAYTLIYSPSTDWSQGGPIMEREGIEPEIADKGPKRCMATLYGPYSNFIEDAARYYGDTYLIAAMRCYVASVYGEIVDDSQAD